MALFAVLRAAALFKSRTETKKNQYTNVLAACTLLDIPTGWDPRAKQSHTMALFAVLRTAALFKSRAETKKNQYTNVYWFFLVGAAGFEPTASSSRTRRATNCAMPRKYRNPMGCGLVGDERIELPQVESESTALPLCKSPLFSLSAAPCAADKGYYTQKARACQPFFYFFCKSFPAVLLPAEMHRGSV